MTEAVTTPIKYQRRAVSVRSATGPQRNRQRLADSPIATIEAATVTEKPARVKMKARVIEAKPLLMPDGSTRKKKMAGFVEPDSCAVLLKQIHWKLFPGNYATDMM